MEIIRLENENSPYFEAVYDWNYAWWGVRDGISPAEVRCTLAHSLNRGDRLPQTFVAVEDGQALGMYQLSMIDDLYCRPDLYPWLIDVYVAEPFRGRGVGRKVVRALMDRGRVLGYETLGVREIYDFNAASIRCFMACGFAPVEKTEQGWRYEAKL